MGLKDESARLLVTTSVSVESEDFQRFLVGSFDLEGAIVNLAGIVHFLNF